jgi:negative regulator of replication initiation
MTNEGKTQGGNFGIQANTVNAEVQAVGPRAVAQKYTVLTRHGVAENVAALRALLNSSNCDERSRVEIERHIDVIDSESHKSDPEKSKVAESIGTIKRILGASNQAVTKVGEFLTHLDEIGKILGIGLGIIGIA